jgi:hypothetical protein
MPVSSDGFQQGEHNFSVGTGEAEIRTQIETFHGIFP